jgi:small subunit ribosomal protein S8
MSQTDPIADFLTRIRNASRIKRDSVDVPASRLKRALAEALKSEGYIRDVKLLGDERHQGVLRLYLKYGADGERVINMIDRVSKPGRRVYTGAAAIPKVRNGLGVAFVSTPLGVLSDRECRAKNVGGEVLCTVW